MCYAVQCKKCGKTTWAGCGMHKNSVMEKVPENERCQCPREESYFTCEIIWNYYFCNKLLEIK